MEVSTGLEIPRGNMGFQEKHPFTGKVKEGENFNFIYLASLYPLATPIHRKEKD